MRDLAFRDLGALTTSSHPYVDEFKRRLDSLHPSLWARLELVAGLEPNIGRATLSYLLNLTCQCQNMLNIELGRAGLLALPREWLLAHIEEVVETQLRPDDEWEYRRLLEVCWKLDGELVRNFVLSGLRSKNPEVRQIAEDCLKEFSAA